MRTRAQDRPITPEAERAEILLALECVDAAVIFDEDTPDAIIKRVQPDVLVKGADWGPDNIVGRDTVEARGGRVVRMELVAWLLDDGPDQQGKVGFLKSGSPHVTMELPMAHLAFRARWALRIYAMTTATSLTLRALFSRAASKASLDRPARRDCRPDAGGKALAATVAARAATGVTLLVVPIGQGRGADDGGRPLLLRGARRGIGRRRRTGGSSAAVAPGRSVSRHDAAFPACRRRALAHCTAPATGTARLIVASARRAAAARQPAGAPVERLARHPVRDGN